MYLSSLLRYCKGWVQSEDGNATNFCEPRGFALYM